jgi:hypothetical protein
MPKAELKCDYIYRYIIYLFYFLKFAKILPKYREYATKIYLCFTFEKKTKMAAQSSLPGAFFQYVIWEIWQTCPKNLAKLVKFTNEKKTFLQKKFQFFCPKTIHKICQQKKSKCKPYLALTNC